MKVLSDNPLFVLVNTYTGGLSGTIIENALKIALENVRPDVLRKGKIFSDEIGLKMEGKDMVLPCGITTKLEIGGNK